MSTFLELAMHLTNGSSSVLNQHENTGDVFTNLYPALVQCFAIILLGYGSGRLGIIPPNMAKGLGKFLSHIILPAFLFKAMVTLKFSAVNWKFLAAILIAKGIVFTLVAVFGYISSRPRNVGRAGIYAIFATQSNDFAFGYPILEALYHDCHPEYLKYIYLLAPISVVCLNPIGFFMMEYHRENSANQTNLYSKVHCLIVTLKGVVTNPIVFMTFIGVIGNLLLTKFSSVIPVFLDNILNVLSSAFPGTALFYLGLSIVSNGETKGRSSSLTLIIPLVLVAVKTLMLPVLAFEMVSSLGVGSNSSESLEWGTFGFLYGTIPTAPTVFIYASRFSIELETVTTGLVLCTFMAAPLMYLAAKMMTLHYSMKQKLEYNSIIQGTVEDTSYVNIVATSVMLILFILGRKYQRTCPHNYTMCLLICQLFTSLALILSQVEGVIEHCSILEFILYFMGVYGSRSWTAMVAMALYCVRCKGYSVVTKNRQMMHLFGWGFPIFCTGIALCFVDFPGSKETFISKIIAQECIVVISLIVLLICVGITITCLMSVKRCDKYCTCKSSQTVPDKYANVVDPDVETNLIQNKCDRCKEVFGANGRTLPCSGEMPDTIGDIENLGGSCMLKSTSLKKYGTLDVHEQRKSSLTGLEKFEHELTVTEFHSGEKHQLSRHIALLVLLIMSMLMGIAMVFWRWIDYATSNGIFLEMTLLDDVLNYSQGFIIFFIFGFEKQLVYWPFVKRWRKLRYGVDKIKLPEQSDLDTNVFHICEQFNRYHKQRCQQNIVQDRRYNFRTYKSVFFGRELVEWLLEIGLAVDRYTAIAYGRTLLDGRVIRHIHDEHHFADLPYLYQFCQE